MRNIEKITKTKLLVRTNSLKSSNFRFDLNAIEAFSYDWWKFVTVFKGLVIFNNTTYSVSTSKHQRKAYAILNIIGKSPDLILSHTKIGLYNVELALEEEIKGISSSIKDIEEQISKKGSRKATNIRRLEQIAGLQANLNYVESIYRQLIKEN